MLKSPHNIGTKNLGEFFINPIPTRNEFSSEVYLKGLSGTDLLRILLYNSVF